MDGGLDNPASVNIKGPKGDKGDKGDTGPAGPAGPAGTDGKDADIPVVTALAVNKSESAITFTETLADGSREIVLTIDSNGIPTGMTVDGVEIPLTMGGF